jgi:MoxR-like ATPase
MTTLASDISESSLDSAELRALIRRFQQVRDAILAQVHEVIVGQDDVLEQILIALFVGGHCLITGLPGTAKTLMVRTIAQTLGLVFKRIQFTPDLMPSDITGTDIIEEDPTSGGRRWTFVPGPIFGNILLADEINRTPPKTQAALLEAMQERTCTVRGNVYPLPAPFFVLATQNPIELEGTYPLPEAQLDRFLLRMSVGYPSRADEWQVLADRAARVRPPGRRGPAAAGRSHRRVRGPAPVAAHRRRWSREEWRSLRAHRDSPRGCRTESGRAALPGARTCLPARSGSAWRARRTARAAIASPPRP